ncbi:MAG: putative toxin-antitoxin system toxin component, PIN family [Chitinophagaceae bacterium]
MKATLLKKRLQKYLDTEIVGQFWNFYNLSVAKIQVVSTVSVCRDPNDNFLLALDKDAKADYLITGDKDLLDLHTFENTIICTLTDFIDKYLNK